MPLKAKLLWEIWKRYYYISVCIYVRHFLRRKKRGWGVKNITLSSPLMGSYLLFLSALLCWLVWNHSWRRQHLTLSPLLVIRTTCLSLVPTPYRLLLIICSSFFFDCHHSDVLPSCLIQPGNDEMLALSFHLITICVPISDVLTKPVHQACAIKAQGILKFWQIGPSPMQESDSRFNAFSSDCKLSLEGKKHLSIQAP